MIYTKLYIVMGRYKIIYIYINWFCFNIRQITSAKILVTFLWKLLADNAFKNEWYQIACIEWESESLIALKINKGLDRQMICCIRLQSSPANHFEHLHVQVSGSTFPQFTLGPTFWKWQINCHVLHRIISKAAIILQILKLNNLPCRAILLQVEHVDSIICFRS